MEEPGHFRHAHLLPCKRSTIYTLLIFSAGMMGAYTFILRGGVFCNAQTANIALMAIELGQGRWKAALYFLIPISAYFLGAFLSELLLLSPDRKLGRLRWDTCLIIIESLVLFGIGFLPLSAPDQIVQVLINFIASMQYNTFRRTDGITMATTFCTNHIRQLGISAAKCLRNNDPEDRRHGLVHLRMLFGFLLGGVVLSFGSIFMAERCIWLALIPLLLVLWALAKADLTASRSGMEDEGCCQ